MAATETENSRADKEIGFQGRSELPQCHCRSAYRGGHYRCEAAAGAIVSADDCRACSIPGAVSHKDACLYLVPLRDEGKACYACRWFFTSATEPVVDDWRKLCFCSYWFPRGGDEQRVLRLTAPRRVHYLQVLRGEAPRRATQKAPPLLTRAPQPPCRRSPLSRLQALWRRIRRQTSDMIC